MLKKVFNFALIVVVLAAVGLIIFPLFARPAAYSGPSMSIDRIEDAILFHRARTGYWPRADADIQPYLKRKPRRSGFHIVLRSVSTDGKASRYEITTVDRSTRTIEKRLVAR